MEEEADIDAKPPKRQHRAKEEEKEGNASPSPSVNHRRACALYDDIDVAVLQHGLDPPALTHHGTALIFPNPCR